MAAFRVSGPDANAEYAEAPRSELRGASWRREPSGPDRRSGRGEGVELGDRLVLDRLRERSVAEGILLGLAVGQGPVHEGYEGLALVRVLLVLVDEQVGVRGDRVGRCALAVDDGTRTEVGREVGGGGLGGGRHAVGRTGDELAVRILDLGRWQVGLDGVLELGVTDCAVGLLHAGRDAIVALRTDADWPLDFLALADARVPFRADRVEVRREGIRRAGAVGAMDDEDGLVGQRRPGVVRGDRRVIPFLDRAKEDPGDVRGVEVQVGYALDVEDHHDRAEGRRHVEDLRSGRKGCDFRVLHRRVRGTEVDRLLGDPLDAAAGTDRLVVDLDVRIFRAVVLEPLRVERGWERRPRALEGDRGGRPFPCGHRPGTRCRGPIRGRCRFLTYHGWRRAWRRAHARAGAEHDGGREGERTKTL